MTHLPSKRGFRSGPLPLTTAAVTGGLFDGRGVIVSSPKHGGCSSFLLHIYYNKKIERSGLNPGDWSGRIVINHQCAGTGADQCGRFNQDD